MLLVALLLPVSGVVLHATDAPYREEVLEEAHRLNLHEDPYWHILVHYKHTLRGVESLVDDPAFFLAEDGKTNPSSELDATIRSFFEPVDDDDDPVVCRFVARFEWIRERLNLDTTRLPAAGCSAFMDFLDRIKPESVALVFPMSHMNSPASMFGHTLLTIDTADRTKLLAYSVSYSAVTDETFGPAFALKGLFGFYPGYFTVLPYYLKLQQYSDVDHRDIWEYPLNLTEPEIRRMLLHIRELDSIASDYYFFDENCSYLLYFLLEAARPSARLTDSFHTWVIPLDSIRKIEEQGLISDAHYRPSRTTKINHLTSQLSDQAQECALAMARGMPDDVICTGDEVSEVERVKICELAGEYLQYRYTRGNVPESIYQERFLNILNQRSRLGISTDEDLYQIPAPLQPEKGHRSSRFAMGAGVWRNDVFAEMRLRPAYHHLMDADDGYIPGTQLVFADIALRWYPTDNRLILQGLDLIDIISLSPRDRFFQPVSWKIKTGLTRIMDDDDRDILVYQINPGGGFTFSSESIGLMYVMLETDLNVSGALNGNYAAGVGGSTGVIMCPKAFWKLHVFGRTLYYGFADHFSSMEATMQHNLTLQTNQSISVDVSRQKTQGFYQTRITLLLNFFF